MPVEGIPQVLVAVTATRSAVPSPLTSPASVAAVPWNGVLDHDAGGLKLLPFDAITQELVEFTAITLVNPSRLVSAARVAVEP